MCAHSPIISWANSKETVFCSLPQSWLCALGDAFRFPSHDCMKLWCRDELESGLESCHLLPNSRESPQRCSVLQAKVDPSKLGWLKVLSQTVPLITRNSQPYTQNRAGHQIRVLVTVVDLQVVLKNSQGTTTVVRIFWSHLL